MPHSNLLLNSVFWKQYRVWAKSHFFNRVGWCFNCITRSQAACWFLANVNFGRYDTGRDYGTSSPMNMFPSCSTLKQTSGFFWKKINIANGFAVNKLSSSYWFKAACWVCFAFATALHNFCFNGKSGYLGSWACPILGFSGGNETAEKCLVLCF